MASGKVPFDADNFMGILTQHMYKAPVPIRALVPEVDVPPGLDAIILKCLTKKPEGRYASMDELVADLEKARAGRCPTAAGRDDGALGRLQRPGATTSARRRCPSRSPRRPPTASAAGALPC